MEEAFAASLNALRPEPAYIRLFKAVVLDVWNAKRKGAVSMEAALRRRGEEINNRRDRLTEAYLYRSAIDADTYQRELDKLKAEAAQVEGERQDATWSGSTWRGCCELRDARARERGHYVARRGARAAAAPPGLHLPRRDLGRRAIWNRPSDFLLQCVTRCRGHRFGVWGG
jgi:hypothetical protein